MTRIRSTVSPPPRRPENPFDHWKPRPRWLVRTGLLVVVVLVVGGLWWGVDTLGHACGGLGSGVTEIDGECVGVTDGSYVFDPALADIQQKIAAENARVQGSGHTVTIALLRGMTADDTSPSSITEVRNELEGAYTAQKHVNEPGKLGDNYPLIRLVLANEGTQQDKWYPVVQQLKEMVDDEEPLVAVTGFGSSITNTALGAQELAKYGIPMVASSAAADELNYTRIHGFIRIVPSAREYVQSLLGYLQRRPGLDSAVLVYDTNSDDPKSPDLFPRSLRNNFRSDIKILAKDSVLGFTGRSGFSDAHPDLFNSVIPSLCAVKSKVVLYAGRQRDLFSFVTALEGRLCTDVPITIVTVATDLSAFKSDEAKLRDKKITVVYATVSNPRGWASGVPGTPARFADFRSEFDDLGLDVAHIDGGATTTHDAVLTAVKAIRLAIPASGNSMPKPADVLGQLLNLNNLNTVPGASGELSFGYRGDESGNPAGKPIHVLEIPSSGPFPAENDPPYITGESP